MSTNASHKGLALRRKDSGFAVLDEIPDDDVFRFNPETGVPEQRGFDGQYHPRAHFVRPTTHERVRRAYRETRALVGELRPLELFALTRDVMVEQFRR